MWTVRDVLLWTLALPALLWWHFGWESAVKLHLVPVFLVFPVAFTLNRLGQHYDVDPEQPAHWGTLIKPSPLLWDRVFLWSNYHLEHHYFPRVPFYNLRRLNRELRPFFRQVGLGNRTYGKLLWGWLVKNRQAHTPWDPASE